MVTITVEEKFIQKIEYQSGNQPLYLGEAAPGTGVDEDGWRIQLFEYGDGNNSPPTGILFAGGEASFRNRWGARSGYEYS